MFVWVQECKRTKRGLKEAKEIWVPLWACFWPVLYLPSDPSKAASPEKKRTGEEAFGSTESVAGGRDLVEGSRLLKSTGICSCLAPAGANLSWWGPGGSDSPRKASLYWLTGCLEVSCSPPAGLIHFVTQQIFTQYWLWAMLCTEDPLIDETETLC